MKPMGCTVSRWLNTRISGWLRPQRERTNQMVATSLGSRHPLKIDRHAGVIGNHHINQAFT